MLYTILFLSTIFVDTYPDTYISFLPILVASALGSAATGIGNVVGSIISGNKTAEAQESANQTNIQLAREAMAYQTGEREAVQEYNTPANQRKRYEEAGINPYFALGNIQGGNATAQTAPSMPTVQPVTGMADAYKQIGASLGDTIGQIPSTILQMKSLNADVEGKLLDNKSKVIALSAQNDRQILELQQMRENILNSKADYKTKSKQLEMIDEQLEQAKLQGDYLKEYLEGRNEEQRNNAELSYQKTVTEKLQRTIAKADLQIRRRLADSQIKLNDANENQLIASKDKLVREALELKHNGISERALKAKMKDRLREEINQMKIDTKTKERIYDNYWPIIDPIIERIGKLGATLIGAAGLVYGSKLPKASAAPAASSQSYGYGFTNMP